MEASDLMPLSDTEFLLFQRLVHNSAGIWLPETKKALVSGRLTRRIRELGLRTFRQYYQKVVSGDSTELVLLVDRISTNETHFFRESKQFAYLNEVVFPQFLAEARETSRPRRLRIWCAGCSTGEEPYSLGMSLLAHSDEFAEWDIRILATDISSRVLDKARKAFWPIEKAHEIPRPLLRRFMLKGVGPNEGSMSVVDDIRTLVIFQRLNLNETPYSTGCPFDLIFCRNVLIYFNMESKQRIANALLDRLTPDGYYFTGHSENLTLLTNRIRTIHPTIYKLRRNAVELPS